MTANTTRGDRRGTRMPPKLGIPKFREEGNVVAYTPHPFIDFPLWGLQKALEDHQHRCSACSESLSSDCIDKRYADMLKADIRRLSRA